MFSYYVCVCVVHTYLFFVIYLVKLIFKFSYLLVANLLLWHTKTKQNKTETTTTKENSLGIGIGVPCKFSLIFLIYLPYPTSNRCFFLPQDNFYYTLAICNIPGLSPQTFHSVAFFQSSEKFFHLKNKWSFSHISLFLSFKHTV